MGAQTNRARAREPGRRERRVPGPALRPGYAPIEEYGIIGDLQTVALVGTDGALDFLCFPHFDSPSLFAGLLDRERGGTFRLAPVLERAHAKQLYLPDTPVMITRFLSEQGVAEVSDFMPVEERGKDTHEIVRRAKTVRGEVRFRMTCDPRFDYGRQRHTVDKREGEVLFLPKNGGSAIRLRTPVPVRIVDGGAVAEFTLRAGETAAFILEEAKPGNPGPASAPEFVPESFKNTVNFWRRWVARSTYRGRWRETVNRSAITLKLLTSQRYGSIVAAPTFGLPERIGGERNWDYRFAWIRDGSFTLYALMRLGYTDEAAAYMRWIEDRCRDARFDAPKKPGKSRTGSAVVSPLQIVYRLDGSRELTEDVLPQLEGYRGSAPVRIGNGAAGQLQLDIYGELMDSVYLYDKSGAPISYDLWKDLTRLVDWTCEHWRAKDEGIWEVRGGRREFLYSKLMCWVAVDRAVRLATKRSFPAPVERWRRTRDEIYEDVMTGFWDPERRAFTQSRGSRALDASALLMPLVRFLSPTDPRWLSTLAAIEEDLVDDSLVYRYRLEQGANDGLSGNEGTFSMCSFWLVECIARAGDLPKARYLFEKILGYANHLGLYSEELGPSGEHLGNYPQAFTHVALISAAFELNRRLEAGGHG